MLGRQRTPVQDTAFPLRQLADVALKGLSPAINDPTTAENAIEALTSLLIRSATGEHPSRLRADEHGVVRLVRWRPISMISCAWDFEKVRVFAAPYPAVSRRLLTLLARVDDAARAARVPWSRPARAALIAGGPVGSVPTSADVSAVRAARRAVAASRCTPSG